MTSLKETLVNLDFAALHGFTKQDVEKQFVSKKHKFNDGFNNELAVMKLYGLMSSIDEIEKDKHLRLHQNSVLIFLKKYYETIRGFIAVHEMGTGKTKLALHAFKAIKELDPNKQLVFAGPKSIHANFKKEYEEEKEFLNYKLEDIKFLSSNASNFFTKLMLVNANPYIIQLEKDMGQDFIDPSALENTAIIFDEAHNILSSISNAKRIMHDINSTINDYRAAERVYNLIMNTNDIKLIFLTGTPIKNNLHELAMGINMIKGYISSGYNNERDTVFPEVPSAFEAMFIDKINIKNRTSFINRMYGAVSYYGSQYYDKDTKAFFPTLKRQIVYVEMGKKQFIAYCEQAIKDIQKLNNLNVNNSGEMNLRQIEYISKFYDSIFKIKTKEISNIFIPNENVNEALQDLDNFGPKFKVLMQNIKLHPGKSIIYSSSIEYGTKIVEKLLQKEKLEYKTITGMVDPEIRSEIVKSFNNDEFNYLIISSSGAEGLDLKGCRCVHMLESHWNNGRLDQVETRAKRFKSHHHLPENERNIKSFLYLSTFGKYQFDLNELQYIGDARLQMVLETSPINVAMYNIAQRKQGIYEQMMECIRTAAFDCYIHANDVNDCVTGSKRDILLYRPTVSDAGGADVSAPYLSNSKKMFKLIDENGDTYIYKIIAPDKYDPMSIKYKDKELPELMDKNLYNKSLYNISQYLKNPSKYIIKEYDFKQESFTENKSDWDNFDNENYDIHDYE